jgi:hypothetical protein
MSFSAFDCPAALHHEWNPRIQFESGAEAYRENPNKEHDRKLTVHE